MPDALPDISLVPSALDDTQRFALALWLDAWTDGLTLSMLAGRLTRDEMEGVAYLLSAFDHVDSAKVLVQQWIEEEISDGECGENTYLVTPDGLLAER